MQKTPRPPFRTALRGALRLRCPYCRQGRVLARWPNKIFPECPSCGLSFFREQGYYIGGMIFTYGFTIAVVIPVFLALLYLPDMKAFSQNARFALWVLFAVPLSLLFMPYAYSLWLHLDFWLEPWKPPARPQFSAYFEKHLVSPDGKFLFARDINGKAKLYPIAGGDPTEAPQDVAGWMPDDVWITWAKDGKEAYVFHDEKTSATVYRLNVTSGKRELVGKLAPDDPAGVTSISNVSYTPDGKSYAYSGTQELSELFIAAGVK